jgi:hypothetical protein
MALALAINILFFFNHNPNVYFAITQAHGQVGYHVCMDNSVLLNPSLKAYMEHRMCTEGHLIDYCCMRSNAFSAPTQAFPINDTIGYGLLLGALWKVTDSFKFVDVQILQIMMYVLLMSIYYQLALLLFGSSSIAFVCGLAHLCFFPLIAYNVMPVRDVWAYYGLLVLVYAVCAYVHNRLSLVASICCALFFALCLWMRPTLFFALIMLSGYALAFGYIKKSCKRAFSIIGVFLITVLMFFWLPYMCLNNIWYDRYVVSPAGQSLLEGLGEIKNPWGHQLNDEYVAAYIGNKYGLKYGTVAFDEAAMGEFVACVMQNPWHYIKTLLYRVSDVVLPGLQWIFYADSPYVHCVGLKEKLCYVCSSWYQVCIFIVRHIYMRVYILIAWLGMVLLWRRRKYKIFWLINIVLVSGLTTFPSHIEYRYLVPYYWIFSLAVGYVCCYFSYLRHTVLD